MWLINWRSAECFNTHASGVYLSNGLLCLGDCARIIDVANHNDLKKVGWIVCCPDTFDRLVNHRFFVSCWQQNSEGELRRQKRARTLARLKSLWMLPRVEHEIKGEDGLRKKDK